MKLTILGCDSPYPAKDGACSGYLLADDNTNILIDCGHAVFTKLYNTIDIAKLDGIIITHFHPDHYVDLYAIRHYIRLAIKAGLREDKLPLLIPTEPNDMFNYWNSVEDFRVIPLNDKSSYLLKSLTIIPHTMIHPILTYGIEVKADNKAFFYTADTSYDENMLKLPRDITLLLGEVTFLANQASLAKETGHMSVKDLASMANMIMPKLLIATHLWSGFSRNQIEQEIKSFSYLGEFIVASNGKEILF